MTLHAGLREKSIAVVYGTRPEIIKLAPLVRLLGPAAKLVSTGQHFDVELFDGIASDMTMPPPAAVIEVGGKTRASQIGMGVLGLEPLLVDCDAVIVQGDTNSSLAGALTANSLEIPLFHVEAGLRSYDRLMPEEHNRVLVDHIADVCWAPTNGNVQNLLSEGIPVDRIELTGNSIVEALEALVPSKAEREQRRSDLGCPNEPYVVSTLHRPENVDDPKRLGALLEELVTLPIPVVLPIHPRTKAVAHSNGLGPLLDQLFLLPPLGYRDFLSLLADCSLSISDSGGIQEEVSILKVPLVVVRRSTERSEVVGTFARLIVDPSDIMTQVGEILGHGVELRQQLLTLPSPFGDGRASERMYASLLGRLNVW